MCYFLAKNSHVQKKAQDTIDEILKGQDPTYDQLEMLTYIEYICKETMRLMPPVPQTARRSLIDFTWNGVLIPKDVSHVQLIYHYMIVFRCILIRNAST